MTSLDRRNVPRDDAAASDRPFDRPSEAPPRLVDWEGTARRIRRSALVLLGAAVLAWFVVGALDGDWSQQALANWLGLAVLAMFVAEVVVVGGSAARGLLRAGDRGERLSGADVGLFPPTRSRPDDADEA